MSLESTLDQLTSGSSSSSSSSSSSTGSSTISKLGVQDASNNWTFPLIDPPYQKNFEWEKFDYPFWRQWMGQRWWWSLVFGGVYVFLIYTGQRWMKDRVPMKLKNVLLTWNIFLATFSITAFTRTLPEMVSIVGGGGWQGLHVTVCSRDQMTMAHVFWEWMGTLSKVVELGDTAFIVLRKQPLIFLHWYHHISVLVYTWYSIDTNDPIHRWYMSMNSGIHSLMYTYYALRAIGVKIPRIFALCVTTLQILQMFMGFSLNIYSVYAKYTGLDCCRPNGNIVFALLMYSSYLILFLHFFYMTYLRPKSKPKSA